MVEKESIRKDLSFLSEREDVLAVLLYGSIVKGEAMDRSDVDICIVAPGADCRELLSAVYRRLDVYGKKYDVRVFEELPLYIKAQVIENHEVLYTRDIYELYEYFYFARKPWDDQAHRQKLTREEMARML